MKRNILIWAAISSLVCLSCQKITGNVATSEGTLEFSSLSVDEAVETKAAMNAGGNFVIDIIGPEGETVLSTTWSQVNSKGGKISLPEASYTLRACSSMEGVPAAAFEQPVYGV